MIQKVVDGVVTSYVYNVEDRLTEVWDGEVGTGTLVAEYYYDPFGRRLWKEVSGVKTHFHYADEGLIGEYDSAGAEIKTYGYKPNSTWTTDPLFMKIGSEYYFYHNDHLDTPQKMTGVNGAVVWSAKYESFGRAELDAASTVTNNLRFPGQYEDAETGLCYNWFRYYHSETGRYLRKDPIGMKGGTNLYLYVENSPIIKIDPLGLIAYEGPNPCEGYRNIFNSRCCRDNNTENDPYPEAAHSVCNGFMEMYDYRSNSTVRCVANCLVSAESNIQDEYNSCSQRNSARLRAHIRCYATCGFVPVRGLPEGGAEVGINMLLPDFVRNPFSLWDGCTSQDECSSQ